MASVDSEMLDAIELRARLSETEQALAALRSGAADAILGVTGSVHQLSGAEKPYLTYFRAMGEGGVTLDQTGHILHGNPRFAEMVGQPISKLHGALFLSFLAPADRSAFTDFLLSATAAATEVSLNSLSGTMPVRVSMNVIDIGPLRATCLVVTDLRERAKAEAELRIAAIAFESQDGIVVTDPGGVIIRVNGGFTRRTGYAATEVVGRTPAVLHSGRQSKAFYAGMWEALKQTGYWQGEIWNRSKCGNVYAEWVTISAVRAPDGRISHYVGVYSDISKNKEALAEIHRLAYYDPLTGLPNRRLLLDRMCQALAGCRRSKRHGALLFLDLDKFKNLNDTRGHDVGDQLLIEVARRIRANVREVDTVARLGGDEFVVMLEELSTDAKKAAMQTRQVGEKLRVALARPYNLPGRDHHCAASLGATIFLGTRETVETLLKQADLALYKAKESGRNALHFFDPTMQTALNERAALEADLHVALDHQQFELYYQPQIGSNHQIIGAEALLRWMHPTRGVVQPGEFIAMAEDTGLIVPIGMWVLDAACAQVNAWSGATATRDLQLAINISARQFRNQDLVDQVSKAVERSGIDPSRLKFELTESTVIANFEDSVAKMRALSSLGIRFSLDDFGTGYSSLSYLTRLPLSQIKIDRSFVANVPDVPRDAVIVQTIVTMATNLKLDVIAEGVETEAQHGYLEQLGCNAFQGYLFSRPLPCSKFEQFLARSTCADQSKE